MIRNPYIRVTSIFAVIVLFALTGCFGKSRPARFYTLSTVSEGKISKTGNSSPTTIAVGIGPVKLADYLDQSRIVTRTSDNVIKQADFDQWSGTLGDNLTNVLAENIGLLMGTGQVYIYPWRTYIPVDYQLIVDIVQFDGQPGKEVLLIARWSVLTGEENTLLMTKRSDIREKISGSGYPGFVAAQSRALGKLSQEIVEEIHDVNKK